MRILKVTSYDEAEEGSKEITLSPGMIKAIIADPVAHVRQGKAVKSVTLLLVEGDALEMAIGQRDLDTLEEVVGSYDWE